MNITQELFESEKKLFKEFLQKEELPTDWIEKNISLPINSKYALKGKVKLDEFQKYIINYTLGHTSELFRPHYINIRSAVQIGKSFIAEMIIDYLIKFRHKDLMLCYTTAAICKEVIKYRLGPVIKENNTFESFITGYQDDFSADHINLNSCSIRFASAEAADSTIASFSIPYIIASEVSKYPNTANSKDIVQMLKGRKTFHEKLGDFLVLLESSPIDIDDQFGRACSESDIQLYPHVKLSCGHRAFLEDKIIEVIKDQEGKSIQDPKKILENVNNAWVVCPKCHQRTYERDHIKLLKSPIIYANNSDEIIDDKQPEYRYDNVTFNLNKLLNEGYRFIDCMADLFKAKNKKDGGKALKLYHNETMGRSHFISDELVDENVFVPNKLDYYIYRKDRLVPANVKYAVLGGDTQEDRIYYTIYGLTGNNCDLFLLDSDSINFTKQESTQHNLIYDRFYKYVFEKKIYNELDEEIQIICGAIDEGGHHKGLINHIIGKLPNFYSYKGSSQYNKRTIGLVERSEKDRKLIFGHTEFLSKEFYRHMHWLNDSKLYLPQDVSSDYMDQINSEYWVKTTFNGIDKYKFVQLLNNHLRSCSNYAMAAIEIIDGFNPNSVKVINRIKNNNNTSSSNNNLKELMQKAMSR